MSRSTSDGRLALGVKGRLSNQEMELLRNKLAHAVAYDHVSDTKRAERHAKALQTAKPMTKVYRVISSSTSCPDDRVSVHRPAKKTLASIQYEATFNEHAYDSLRVPPPTKGISTAAKTRLQDEYVTKPRVVSTIPVNLMVPPTTTSTDKTNQQSSSSSSDAATKSNARSGKRMGPAAIPQVFL